MGAATTMANGADAYMGGSLGARYTKWFGAADTARINKVKANFVAIKDAFANKPVTVDCGCKKTYYAYVYPNQPYKIYVCKAFWTAPLTGTDSKGGTLVHEMSHFSAVAGTHGGPAPRGAGPFLCASPVASVPHWSAHAIVVASATAWGPDMDGATPTYFVHPLADCQTSAIGANSRIWQFCVVLARARIGANCNINSHCFIENEVTLGDDVTLKCGVYLWDGIVIEDRVFIGPNVTFSNDKLPRSKVYPAAFLPTLVREGASIGAGAVLLPGLTIGRRAMIGAGAVVTRDVPDDGVVYGDGARLRRIARS